jgi:hypothetical protein
MEASEEWKTYKQQQTAACCNPKIYNKKYYK